eukprot:TRINITY_DN3467_c0_g1_i2.p1 TRINITY_DN3467_c0_g1~~TRINITY_DN3467_c0_g1_i2.p1  ORF type:complete len:358 (-),score=116.42 TRINITY_DN3467_c0_g1_i2:197-1270(-)
MARSEESEKEPTREMKSKDWGVYQGPWPYKCATQLPDEEVLPRLRRYLELGERRLPYFLKPMDQLSPTEQLAVVAAINACASSIFNQCTTVRGQWERTYQPDLSSPNNKEKLKKFAKIVKAYPNKELLPLLESLVESKKEPEAFQVLKSIRKLAHVNKNGTRRSSETDIPKRSEENLPSRKKQRVEEPLPESYHASKRTTRRGEERSPPSEVGFPGLMRAAEEESRRESQEYGYKLPPFGSYHPSSPLQEELESENAFLRSEVRSMTMELYDLRRRLACYEPYGTYPSSHIRPPSHYSTQSHSHSHSQYNSFTFPAPAHIRRSPSSESPSPVNSDGEKEYNVPSDKARVMSIMNPVS